MSKRVSTWLSGVVIRAKKRVSTWLSGAVIRAKRVSTWLSGVVTRAKKRVTALWGVIRTKRVTTWLSGAVIRATKRVTALWEVIRTKRVTTLYVRDDAIHLLVAKGKRIEKWASLHLEPGLVSQGLVSDDAKVAGRINKLFRAANIRKTRVIVGLSGVNSIYRLISLPLLPKGILPSAVEHEARRVIPTPLEDVYLSYQLLPSPRGESRVFLAAFPRNVPNALIRTLRLAGVKPYVMDLAPLALCRTIDKSRAIIVNAQSDALTIMVMEDRLPQLIRWLSLPGELVSLAERLPVITEEIDRTIAFHNASHREKPLDSTVPMFVSGDLVAEPGSWQSLAGKSKCPVSTLSAPLEYPAPFDPNEFIVNIGLACKELRPKRKGDNFSLVNFNALPKVYLPRRIPLSSILVPGSVLIITGLVVYTGLQARDKANYNSALRSQITALESRIAAEQSDAATLQGQVTKVEADIAPVQAKTNIFTTTFTSLNTGQEVVDGDLAEIVARLPVSGSINLTGVLHSGEAVTVSGTAPDENDIFTYATALQTRFPGLIISSIRAVETGGFSFDLLLK